MKLTIRSFCGFILFFFMVSVQAQAKESVAVLNFANYGGKGMDYLTRALPESISASLSELDEIRVVERRNLGKIVDEIALRQSGLVDRGKVRQAGRLSKADVLILGSISGNPSDIVLTLKAVRVRDGKVVDGKVVKAPLSEVFDSANQAARSMAALISGRGIGRLSVSTTPQSARVYVDGLFVGKTPLVEHKVVVGRHRVKVTKEGFLEYEETVDVRARRHERISTRLAEEKATDRMFIGMLFGYMYLFNPDINYGLTGGIQIGQTFDRFILAGEVTFSYLDHSKKFGDLGEFKKWYEIWSFTANLNYVVYRSRIIEPYVGGFLSYSRITDYQENLTSDEEKEDIHQVNSATIGAILGMNFIPYSRIHPFIECRFFYNTAAIERESYTTKSVFVIVDDVEEIHISGITAMGGVRIAF